MHDGRQRFLPAHSLLVGGSLRGRPSFDVIVSMKREGVPTEGHPDKLRCCTKHQRRMDSHCLAPTTRWQTSISLVELNMRMPVQLERAATPASIADANPSVLILNLEIGYVKDGERNIFQFS